MSSTKNVDVRVDPAYVKTFIQNLFNEDMHAARVLSLSNGVVGVLHAAALAIHAIGQAYAKVANIKPKSGVKQVDRLLSNAGLDMRVVLKPWVRFVVGEGGRVARGRGGARRSWMPMGRPRSPSPFVSKGPG